MAEKNKAKTFLSKILKGRPQPNSTRTGLPKRSSPYGKGGRIKK